MKKVLSRRSMLGGCGYAAIGGSLSSQWLSAAYAAEAAAPAAAPAAAAAPAQELMMTTIFMRGPKSKFDTKKYTTKHLPLLRKTYGDNVARIEYRIGMPTARGFPSDVEAITTMYIANLQGFIGALRENSAAIDKDLAEASTGLKNVQIDRILVSEGDPRTEVRENHQVFSTFYRDAGAGKPATTFDQAYFIETYVPKMRSYYGSSAVRRVETHVGVPQGGAKPAIVASVHQYIRERSQYDSANTEAMRELMKTDEKYTNATQMYADTKVTQIV